MVLTNIIENEHITKTIVFVYFVKFVVNLTREEVFIISRCFSFKFNYLLSFVTVLCNLTIGMLYVLPM